MNADSAFVIGATHAVCQDYAVASGAYAILSDGCSTSPDTDIGARLLVKAAERLLNIDGNAAGWHENAALLALSWTKSIEMPDQSIDATLLTAYVSGNQLLVSCSGDGVIVTESHDGALDVYVIAYPSGFPLYPAYLHQPERLEALVSTGRSCKEMKHFRSSSISEPLQLESTASDDSTIQNFSFKSSDYKFVALASDGVHSFRKQVEPVPMSQVLRELFSFKSLHGAFVARRVKRFLKDCVARGWQHADDLSLAVVHLGDQRCFRNESFPA